MWTVKLSKQASQFLDSVSGKPFRQLEAGLDEIRQSPYSGKPLLADLRGYWSFRVGVFRIIYSIQLETVVIEVVRIHHRKEVYEKMRRI